MKSSNLGQNEEHSLWLFTKYYILGLVWWNDSVVKAVDDTADVVAASSLKKTNQYARRNDKFCIYSDNSITKQHVFLIVELTEMS